MAKTQSRAGTDSIPDTEDRKSPTEPPEARPGVSVLPKPESAAPSPADAEERAPTQPEPQAPPVKAGHSTAPADHPPAGQAYAMLAAMAGLSFLAMYVLMYAMVDRVANVFNNFNQVYMAGLMTAPMVLFEVLLMRHMYRNSAANALIAIVSIAALALFWLAIRQQAFVGDQQFLRSMIPHHAGAILMCQEAPLTDERIKALCQQVIRSQQDEIDQMKSLLAEAAPG